MNYPYPPSNRRAGGFTLIEMLVTLVLATVVLSTVWTAFRLQSRVVRTMTDASTALGRVQRLRFQLEESVGKAGLDPLDANATLPFPQPPRFGIQSGDSEKLEFSFDADRNGQLDSETEAWTLELQDGILWLAPEEGEAGRLGPDLESFSMEYLCMAETDEEDNNGDGQVDELGEWAKYDSVENGGDCDGRRVLAVRFLFSVLLTPPNDEDDVPIVKSFEHTVRLWNQPK